MEDEKIEFLTKARNGYLQQAKENPEKFTVIDASQSQDCVAEQVVAILDQLIHKIA
jgi:dTMP kinase